MKRAGRLIEAIADNDNLKLAYLKACRAKPMTRDRLAFRRNFDIALENLHQDLLSAAYAPGSYRYFVIRDPKERRISAAPFRDRVAQHALMNLLDPIFERVQICHSYACRRGKGTQAAVLKVFHHAKSQGWFLKMDVRKYFDSIDHKVLINQLCRRIKDQATLAALNAIIASHQVTEGRGLPIGNLTSQYFANHYLAGLDHFILEDLRLPRYVRYMDDMVLFADSKLVLEAVLVKIDEYLRKRLLLTMKPAVLNRCTVGVPFCGFRVTGGGIYLLNKTKKRFKTKQTALLGALDRGEIGQAEYGERALASCSHVALARSRAFRYAFFRRRFFGL